DLLAARGLTPREYVFATAHRAGNVDDPARLALLVDLLSDMPIPVLFAIHPRTRRRLDERDLLGRLESSGRVITAPPLGYLETAALVCNARAVLTDSGGLQKEAYLAGVQCVTLRASTEWTETVESGWNTLVDLDAVGARRALGSQPPREHPPLYGDGRAGERVLAALNRMVGDA
ncbi:MAG TPA: UDP-N-acetylglucosamine 2-epimerase, partial [Solirubrobacteraceae bacterium]|nr:UDP-N-acetylglucosamine 2-epimerase [Solirubrobacteraceae bacterium]